MLISSAQLTVFLLVLARVIGLFASAPLFNSRSFPAFPKVALAVWVAGLLWFVIPVNVENLPLTSMQIVMSLTSEAVIGLAMGFLTNMVFLVVQAAGEIIDMQMGLSVAQSFDPVFGAQISVIGRLTFFIALMVFLIVNGHHLLLSALNQSFRVIPAGQILNLSSPALMLQLIELGTKFWALALQFAGPIVLIIFLSDFAFGIVSRVAPQVNVFMLGFQVKPALGLIGLVFTLPLVVKHVAGLVELMAETAFKLLLAVR
ncbi:MAG: flagellar biosynthetic protein FliR [Candidatus Margulisiibacteriota bacterium]